VQCSRFNPCRFRHVDMLESGMKRSDIQKYMYILWWNLLAENKSWVELTTLIPPAMLDTFRCLKKAWWVQEINRRSIDCPKKTSTVEWGSHRLGSPGNKTDPYLLYDVYGAKFCWQQLSLSPYPYTVSSCLWPSSCLGVWHCWPANGDAKMASLIRRAVLDAVWRS
jgi:hypothetical protein